MGNPLNIILIILFIGAGQGFLFSIVLFSIRKGNQLANRLLAVMIFLFSFIIFAHSMGELESSAIDKTSYDHIIVQSIFLLFGPLLYLYVRTLTKPSCKLQRLDAIHLLPLIISMIILIPMQNIVFDLTHDPNDFFIGGMIVLSIHFTVYMIFSIHSLMRHSRKIKNTFSSIEKINLNWLKFLITGLLIIFPFATLTEIYGGGSTSWNFVWLIVSVFIYAIGFMSLRQPEIYLGTNILETTGDEKESRKYQKSALTNEKTEEYLTRLKKYISENKPYLENYITLPDLAKKISVSTHHLSQIINEKTGGNFFDYINNFRIDEAKLLLKDPQKTNLTITAIGFESGFNSVSSFNSVFKKIVKMTPSQFRSLS